jgi:hypothetical protein
MKRWTVISSVVSTLFVAAILTFSLSTEIASAHGTHPHSDPCTGPHKKDCGDGGGDPPVAAEPMVVFRDNGVYLANADGSGRTLIRANEGIVPRLDAERERVIFLNSVSLGHSDSVVLLEYDRDGSDINVVMETILVDESQVGAAGFTLRGVSDISPDGTKYSYSYREPTVDGESTRRVVVAPLDVSAPLSQHVAVYTKNRLDFGAWDASGEYIYLVETDPSGGNDLFVIDVRTEPEGNPGEIVGSIDLDDEVDLAGFSALDSNVQDLSAGAMTGSYSISGAGGTASNHSLCLMVAVSDWSVRHSGIFTMIVDLPGLLHPELDIHCPVLPEDSLIPEFLGEDFMTSDSGIVGQDYGKGQVRGIWTYDFGSKSRTKIIGSGFRPDWSQ